jgi:hypothetical protein
MRQRIIFNRNSQLEDSHDLCVLYSFDQTEESRIKCAERLKVKGEIDP